MKIESTSFGPAELATFMDDLIDIDRQALIERLGRDSERLGQLAGLVTRASETRPASGPESGEGTQDWSAHEVLAHIAVLSKFYGVLAYQIGSGRLSELDLLGQVSLRDVMGEQLARRLPDELAASTQADHRRTLDWLRRATPADLRRRCETGGGASMSAEEVARLALCAHLEQHLAQLEAALQ